ncbi:metchnikowin [Drosophila nasuta]|uniref:Metchnikowin n=1 Tax=Drosophila albomicans TaxID=7291 RepID=A0A6P8X8F6_DROAB|nr:metchnikowin [Drosophila albomicans]XP_060652264.1 metchnikowin [Drosophila nasuta]
MQLNLGNICSTPLLLVLLLLASLGVALSEPRHRGPIFDTRPSPFNPQQPRPGGPYSGPYSGPVY